MECSTSYQNIGSVLSDLICVDTTLSSTNNNACKDTGAIGGLDKLLSQVKTHLTSAPVDGYNSSVSEEITNFVNDTDNRWPDCLQMDCAETNKAEYLLYLCATLNTSAKYAELLMKESGDHLAVIPVKFQECLGKALDFLLAVGVVPALENGVGAPLQARMRSSSELQLPPKIRNPSQAVWQLTLCVRILMNLFRLPVTRSAIVSRCLADLMAASMQLRASPNMRSTGLVSPTTADVHQAVLEEIVAGTHKPLLVRELLVMQTGAGGGLKGSAPSPVWFRTKVGGLLSRCLMMDNGFLSLIQASIDLGADKDDWSFADKLSLIACRVPRAYSRNPTAYYANICRQLSQLLIAPDGMKYSQIVATLFNSLDQHHPDMVSSYAFAQIVDPLSKLCCGELSLRCEPIYLQRSLRALRVLLTGTARTQPLVLSRVHSYLPTLMHVYTRLYDSNTTRLLPEVAELRNVLVAALQLMGDDAAAASQLVHLVCAEYDDHSHTIPPANYAYAVTNEGIEATRIVSDGAASSALNSISWLPMGSLVLHDHEVPDDNTDEASTCSPKLELGEDNDDDLCGREGRVAAGRALLNQLLPVRESFGAAVFSESVHEFCRRLPVADSDSKRRELLNLVAFLACVMEATELGNNLPLVVENAEKLVNAALSSDWESESKDGILSILIGIISVVLVALLFQKQPLDEDFVGLLHTLAGKFETVRRASSCEKTRDEADELCTLIREIVGDDEHYQSPSCAEKTTNQRSAEDYDVQITKALRLLHDPLPPVRGHALITIKELIRKAAVQDPQKQESIKNRCQEIMQCLIEQVNEEDSYVFLSAINALAALAQLNAKQVLPHMLNIFTDWHNSQLVRSAELRIKVGEAITKVLQTQKSLGVVYAEQLLPVFLSLCRDEDAAIRASSLSNLASLCTCSLLPSTSCLHELVCCIEQILRSDDSDAVRRAAVHLCRALVGGTDGSHQTLDVLAPVLRDVYRALRRLRAEDRDAVVRTHAALAIEDIDDVIKAMIARQPNTPPLITEIATSTVTLLRSTSRTELTLDLFINGQL